MSTPAIPLSETQTALCIVFLLLAPLACAGLALINTGLGRSRNAAHSILGALCVIAVASCVYLILGRCFQGSAGETSRVIQFGKQRWDWLGAVPAFFAGLTSGSSSAFLVAWMGMVSVSLAGLIPLGSGTERWRLISICASTAALAGITFPIFAHWTWSAGWLASLGANQGLGIGFVDIGGTGTIHVAGGLTALAVTWLLGPRRGKFGHDGMPMAFPGHNVVFTLFGCMLSLVGWIALNATGAILFTGIAVAKIPLIAVNTLLGASSAALVAALITKIRYTRPDASLTANGWVGGLVATASASAFIPPAAALIIGLIAGAVVTFGVELLEMRLDVDDPGGSISVHAIAGIWGLLALGLFGRLPGPGIVGDQVMAQIIGIATLLGFVFPLSFGLNLLLDRFVPMRVSRDGERQGMDLYELGAGAYPDFITHAEDFMQR